MTTNVKLMVVLSKFNYDFMTKLGKNLESLGMPGSTYLILAHLNIVKKEKTQKLGEVAAISSGTITHVVNKMAHKGYVKKSKDSIDKRVFWVEITDKGREKFRKVDDEHMKYLNSILAVFSDEEKFEFIAQVKNFGKKIKKNDSNNLQ